MTTFHVPGTPAPQGSKNAYVRGGRAVLVESSKKVPAWRAAVAEAATQNCGELIDGPVDLTIEFVLPRPKSWRKGRDEPMTARPDVDKLARAVLDALTGIAFKDDSQVVRLSATKRRAREEENAGAYITIQPGKSPVHAV